MGMRKTEIDAGAGFDYYYGTEAEQFAFYQVPRLLVKDARFKGLSSDAKLLYGLMLDRLGLSMKNGWLDSVGRAYIYYKADEIMEDLGCSGYTCTKVLAELDGRKGIGLIERKRQGLGKPDIIYVKNFAKALKSQGLRGQCPDIQGSGGTEPAALEPQIPAPINYININNSTFPADIFKQSLYKCCLRVHPFSHFTFDTGCNICRQSRKLLCKQSHKALKCTG